ncbi:MAG: NUDIX domain-containing protein [Pseudomonadota bacterium]
MTASVHHVTEVSLPVAAAPLSWEAENSAIIAGDWAKARAEKPNLFNGRVHVAVNPQINDKTFTATCHPMQFSGLMYWRRHSPPETGFRNMFGNVVLRGSDGGLIVGRIADHHATGGLTGFPGGSFDPDDIKDDHLDATGCILREGEEETGIPRQQLSLAPGYLVYQDPGRVAICRVADLPVRAGEIRTRIAAWLRRQDSPELAEVLVVRTSDDLHRLNVVPPTRLVAEWIFKHA